MGKKKCMQCKEWINGVAVESSVGGEPMHFCSTECLEKAVEAYKTKQINKANKDMVYKLICDIFGYRIKNTRLYAEWKIWNELADNTTIRYYLTDNFKYIKNVISHLKDQESSRVMYFSAILKNALHDYRPQVETIVKLKEDIFIMHTNNKIVTRKKGFAEDDDDE